MGVFSSFLLMLALVVNVLGMMPDRICVWNGQTPRCCPLYAAASSLLGPLMDFDGAILLSSDDVDSARSNFVLAARGKMLPESKRCFFLRVDFHLGTDRFVAVCEGDDPKEIAEQICASEDVCFMRRYNRSFMAQNVQEGLSRFTKALASGFVAVQVARQDVSIPYILIGEPPDNFKADFSHMQMCTSCELRPHHVSDPAAVERPLDVGTRTHLFADAHAVRSLVGLKRFTAVATKQNGGKPVLVRDKPWEDITFGGYSSVVHDGQCLQMWYRPWRSAVALAVSCDGVTFQKPSLGMWDAEAALLDERGFIAKVRLILILTQS